ncbi:MAG: SDR family oxidoreductase [Hyphomicrobiaceae bacterium]|nr:MAG: SDR family oxidoreductase [Hyphomicrobiaceae bacterium]
MATELFSLKGRHALVTGASTGIGNALARGLAAAGASLTLNARSKERLSAAAATLRSEGCEVDEAPFDVTDGAAARAAVDAIEAKGRPIDILVNNAGLTRRASLEEVSEAAWREVLATNLDGAFLVGQAVARHMIKRRRGKIINICSIMSELARPTTAPYAASKGGLKMLTRAMAIDWGKYGIQANGIAPGYFKTELTKPLVDNPQFTAWVESRTPAGRWGDVKELVGAAVFLASDASSYVSGHLLYVDGGLTASV